MKDFTGWQKFIEFTENKLPEVQEISQILKKMISNVLGKEILSEKVLVVNS